MIAREIKNSSLRTAATALEATGHLPWCEALNQLDDDASDATIAAALAQDAQLALSIIGPVRLAGNKAAGIVASVLKKPNKTTIVGTRNKIHNKRLRQAVRTLDQAGERPYTLETSGLPNTASDHDIALALTLDSDSALSNLVELETAAKHALTITATFLPHPH